MDQACSEVGPPTQLLGNRQLEGNWNAKLFKLNSFGVETTMVVGFGLVRVGMIQCGRSRITGNGYLMIMIRMVMVVFC